MRCKDLLYGNSHMTHQNAVRHYLSKARKIEKSGTYEEKQELINKIYGEYSLDIAVCDDCCCEDFGVCALRHEKNLSKQDKMDRFCFKALIKQLEKMEIKPYKNVRKAH